MCGLNFFLGSSTKDIRFFRPFFDLPTHPSPILTQYDYSFSIVTSDFWKPTYLPKNWISILDVPLFEIFWLPCYWVLDMSQSFWFNDSCWHRSIHGMRWAWWFWGCGSHCSRLWVEGRGHSSINTIYLMPILWPFRVVDPKIYLTRGRGRFS